jgi:hypothetical protein
MPSTLGLRRGIQRRTLFQEHRDQRPVHFVGQVLPLNELWAAGEGDGLIGWNHFVENGLEGVTEPLAGFLPIRQRCHGILHGKNENRSPQPIVPAARKPYPQKLSRTPDYG